MITLVPAAPGTFIIELDRNQHVLTPVVAWQHVQGNVVYPSTVIPHGGLTHGKAILHPNGMVDDPTHKLTFDDSLQWDKFIRTAKPKAAPPASEEAEDGPTDAEVEESHRRAAVAEKDVVYVNFGRKTFKTKSFWAYAGLIDAIFAIEGEQPYPHDTSCSKITRDEFAKLKKNGVPEVVAQQAVDAPVEETTDEDDGMELV